MNKTNPIFEALDGLNENYAAEAVTPGKSKMKKPLKIVMIAVAAAVVSLLAGSTAANTNFKLRFGTHGSNERGFYLNVTSQEFTIPEEFRSLGNYFFDYVDIFPSELFPKFGITMLTSGNFTDTEETGYKHQYNGHADWAPHLAIDIIDDDFFTVTFLYYLRDINIDKPIEFRAKYISDVDRTEAAYHYGDGEEHNAKIITLNDGSLCLVTNFRAVFAYNGVIYEISSAGYGNEESAELYKQVLVDLGIYTPADESN